MKNYNLQFENDEVKKHTIEGMDYFEDRAIHNGCIYNGFVYVDGVKCGLRNDCDWNFNLYSYRVFILDEKHTWYGNISKDDEGNLYFTAELAKNHEPEYEVYKTVNVTEHISEEDYESVNGNSKEISDTFWDENPKTYEVSIYETKRLLDEMHSYHPFPKNYLRSNQPREMESLGNWRDKRFEKLQKQLILTMKHCDEDQKSMLARHIRNLSYEKKA